MRRKRQSMSSKFEQFHAENPHVYRELVRQTTRWVRATGVRKVGISRIYEVARYEIAVATGDPEYKLNNNWRAFYARLIMEQEPGLVEFTLRSSEADWWATNRGKAA